MGERWEKETRKFGYDRGTAMLTQHVCRDDGS